MCVIEQMHRETGKTKVLIRSNWVAYVRVGSVALLVPEDVNRHRQKLNAFIEIMIDMLRR